MSNQYQQNNYRSVKPGKSKENCGCSHKKPKKMNNLVNLQGFKIMSKGGKN
jgi:hypothetical protein